MILISEKLVASVICFARRCCQVTLLVICLTIPASYLSADVVGVNEFASKSEPVQALSYSAPEDPIELPNPPFVVVPEPTTIFGLGSLALAIGGGMLVRNPRRRAAS